MCNPSYVDGIGGLQSEVGHVQKHKTLSEKLLKAKRTGGHASSSRALE
jgi:hypothetical protein